MLWLRMRKRLLLSCLSGLSLLGLTSAPVFGQATLIDHRRPAVIVPATPDCITTPYTAPSTTPTPSPTEMPPTEGAPQVSFGGLASGLSGGESFALATKGAPGAYIDSAVPSTTFRMRFDAAYDNNRPDRAEFFYAKCGCFRPVDSSARGPNLPETSVDYQDINAYLEVAFQPRLSAFVDVPYRFLNPDQNPNTNGFADMYAGFKFAIIAEQCQWLTFQFRSSFTTGQPDRGLGIGFVRLEPALLYLNQLSDRCVFQAELRDSIPTGGTDFAGNVLRYGAGIGYDVIQTPRGGYVTPVGELVGWSVLNGQEVTETGFVQTAGGDFIANAKVGVRFGMGGGSLYFGYARALTGEVWYKDSLRAEFRLNF